MSGQARAALAVVGYAAWTVLCAWLAWWGAWSAIDTTCSAGTRGGLGGVATTAAAGALWAAPLGAYAALRRNPWFGIAAALMLCAGWALAVHTYVEPGKLCW
ncbi:hypothetical protein [Tsukamurella spumae]|uniref:Uncharacterized protein n=1 Tax=Tsukamurella spumae TaxID=44753 RepID=A0A846X836_9ACTN|nr:hypothetical protein [Tsukamurella spumae]NKY19900.1 hypothetical protein [Tsukamurella spumae]